MARGDRKKKIGGHIVTLTNLPNQQIRVGIRGDNYNAHNNFSSRVHGLNAFRRMENMRQVSSMASKWTTEQNEAINEELTAGSKFVLNKDFKWKERGDTLGWNKGTKGTIKSMKNKDVAIVLLAGSSSPQNIKISYLDAIK